MAFNLVCVPIIWFLYPETKRRPLESIKVLFGDHAGSVETIDTQDVTEDDQSRKGEEGRVRATEL